ncbi:MAG TPA: DUF2634 domain-containing protein [Candidatus Blautia faecavium]|uniref:DUF2634 domain-containing protein n=1 Tax=Candidatus Blautia faecavium TaxID=2838487 RepID=A0A9D2LVY3_9FIRM|nr:DUF2634 domain-containing protein [Candidatus Blautia faecavium]
MADSIEKTEEIGLFPVIDIPEFIEEEDDYDRVYRSSPAWDLEKGDFVMDTTNAVPMNEGLEAYRVWCVKAVATARYRCRAYDEDIGSEMDAALKEPDENAVELAIERTITETLLVNPRTESIENFEFTWEGSHVKVDFWVYAVDQEQFPLEIIIKTNER